MKLRTFCKFATAAAALISIAGCSILDDPAIQDCERRLIAKLKAPSTYKRVNSRITDMPGENPPQVWAVIDYDAANVYNTPLRDTEICRYLKKNGGADLSRSLEAIEEERWSAEASQAATDAAAEASRAAEEAAAAASEAAADAALDASRAAADAVRDAKEAADDATRDIR